MRRLWTAADKCGHSFCSCDEAIHLNRDCASEYTLQYDYVANDDRRVCFVVCRNLTIFNFDNKLYSDRNTVIFDIKKFVHTVKYNTLP